MSLYSRGATIGALKAVKPELTAELNAYNAKLAADIKAAVKAFPAKFTEIQAASLLDTAAQWGTKAKAQYGGSLADAVLSAFGGRAVNVDGLQRAITAADDAAKKWRAKIPYVGKPYVYEKDKNKEWAETYKTYIAVYIEAGGLVGERASLNQAQRDLKTEVKDNIKDTFKIGTGLAIAGVAIAGVLLIKKGK